MLNRAEGRARGVVRYRRYAAPEDVKPEALTGPVERALVDLGIDWKDVMAFGVHSERVVIIEGPVGFKRTWWFPAARAQAGVEG